MKDEFIALSWLGVVMIYAAGFMLADGIQALREGHDAAGQIFLSIMFAIVARSDALTPFHGGTFRLRFFYLA